MNGEADGTRGRTIKIAAGLALVLAIGIVWGTGLLDDLNGAVMKGWAERAGWWGPFAFAAMFALGEVLHIPSVIFVVVAGVVWPWTVALPTAYLGAMLASAVVFIVARYLVSGALQDAIRRRLPPEVKRYDDALEERGVRTVAVIRLLTFMSPLMHWVLATSRVKFGDMMVGTAVGLIPGITALVLLGDTAVTHWETAKPYILCGIVLLVAGRVALGIRKRRRQRSEESANR
jgi:uncharacterized membrane protein YdjX (TVP38/TMEM64 family)